jgi:hypothetical protein
MGDQIDIAETLKAFNRNHVSYIVIGGQSVYFHGYHRGTFDIDLIIEDTPENKMRAMEALKSLGLNTKGTPVGRHFYQDLPIDISTGFLAVGWFRAIVDAVEGEIEGVPCKIVSKAHLIMNKKAVGRLRDLNDVEELEGRSQDYIPSEEDGK